MSRDEHIAIRATSAIPSPDQLPVEPHASSNHPAAFSRLLLQHALDALPAEVALLNADLQVVLVNRAWRNLGSIVGRPAGEPDFVGWNYLEVCRNSAATGDTTASEVAAQLERLQGGNLDDFELTYECVAPNATYWFSLRVAAFQHHGQRYVIATHSDITQLKSAELRALRSEQRFARASEASLQAIWEWDVATDQITYSQAALTIFGYSPKNLGGGPQMWLSFVHPDDVESLVAAIEANIRGEADHFTAEYRIRRGDGRTAWVMTRGVCDRDANGNVTSLIGTAIDLTEFKAAVEEIRRNEELLRSIVAAAPLGIALLDDRGIVLSLNPAAAEATGYSTEEVVGTPFEIYLPEEVREQARAVVVAGLLAGSAGASYQGVVSLHRRDGSQCLLETTCVAVDGPGRTRLHTFLRDVTEERALVRLKDEMLSTLGHELRTPLTSIQGFAELMAGGKLPAEQLQSNLEIILREARRMRSLINDFLSLKRVESGRLQYTFDAVQIGELVRTALSSLAPAWWETHTFRVEIPPDLPAVRADAVALASVIDNLLSNALKFSPEGGEIVIRGRLVESRIRLSIEDHGIGIASDEAPHVFESFYRSTAAREHEIGGTGLGLSIARAIVQAHQGRLWLESVPQRGTTVYVELPIAEASDH